MTINIFIEPHFQNSIWCRQQLNAICDEAKLRHYDINIIKSNNLNDIDLGKTFYNNERRLLIYIGTAAKAASQLRSFLVSNNIHVIFINYQSPDLFENYSNIIIDYADAMQKTLRYLVSAGRNRIALYGINPNSSSDITKSNTFNCFLKEISPEYNGNAVYYNYASLQNCYGKFRLEKERYNAVICANDVVALSLIKNMKTSGVNIPEDFYIVSFGDTVLAKKFSPSITTVSADLFELGRQAVYLYSYLNKRESNIFVSVKVLSKLHIRDSTGNFNLKPDSDITSVQTAAADMNNDNLFNSEKTPAENLSDCQDINFYADPGAKEILHVENLLCRLNEFDFKILNGLINSVSVAQMVEKLYTSQQAISYRIKRMCQITEVKDISQLLDLIRPYLTDSKKSKI